MNEEKRVKFNPKNFLEWAKDKTMLQVIWGIFWRMVIGYWFVLFCIYAVIVVLSSIIDAIL